MRVECAYKFQALIRSRDSPLNIQTLISVVVIDATMPMPKLTTGLVDNVPCTNKTRKSLVLIMYIVFLKITTFFLDNFKYFIPIIPATFETVTIKFGGLRVKGRHMEAEG